MSKRRDTQVVSLAAAPDKIREAAPFLRALPLAGIALAAFAAVVLITTYVFPYYSTNNDEAVYRFQAQLLAQGKLYLPANSLSEHFNSFYIINDGQRIYPKYVPAFAIPLALSQLLFGDMRVALGLIAAASVIAIFLVAEEMYDRSVAVLAALFLTLSPLFLLQSGMYLPYMFSFLLNILFFLFFLKALRRQGRLYPTLAGVFFGLSFYARPFTALAFALPMAVYAYHLARKGRLPLQTIAPLVAGAAPFIILTFLYNYAFTGSPIRFPFNIWEPQDTLGFGTKRLGPGMPDWNYTVPVALESTAVQLGQLALWVFGGPLLVLLAAAAFVKRRLQTPEALLLAMAGVVVLGNVFQWGTLISRYGLDNLGPFYYVDLLLPLCLLGAQGLSQTVSLLHKHARVVRGVPASALAAGLLAPCLVVGGMLLVSRIDLNLEHTAKRARVYASVIKDGLDDALVFIPPLYGPFIGLPFGYLTNSPAMNDPVLYARNMGTRNLGLVQALNSRKPYYFRHEGAWDEDPKAIGSTSLIPLTLINGRNMIMDVEVVNPGDKPNVVTYVWNHERTETYVLDRASQKGKSYRFRWIVNASEIHLEGPSSEQRGEVTPSTTTTLNVAVAFSDTLERKTQDIYEERFWFDIRDSRVRIVAPGENWTNADWPTGRWLEQNVAPVIRISVRAQS